MAAHETTREPNEAKGTVKLAALCTKASTSTCSLAFLLLINL